MYVIAEIGINYNSSLENCYKLIDSAVEAGCHAAKFQLFSAASLYPKSAGTLDWKDSDGEYSYDIYDAVKRFELPHEWIDDLIAYCEKRDIEFLVSAFDVEGIDFIVSKGIKRIKLPSYTMTHHPLIEAAAKSGLPLIMSSGGSTLAELEEAIRIVQKYHNKLSVLHCSIQYPTSLSDVNMGVLDTLSKAFPEVEIGYSDHTQEPSDAPVQAVYLGATVIEKHITLDKQMEGPDHFFALEPYELKTMVDDINQAVIKVKEGSIDIRDDIYGNSAKVCHEHEQYLRDFAYVAMFAKRAMRKGEVITPNDISILRPGKKERGLDPKYLTLFQNNQVHAKSDIAFEDPISWEKIL
jgi:N,N'-diacetyllegionaminate synthase